MANTIQKSLVKRGCGWCEYALTNVPQEWTETQILDYCDMNNFGGALYSRFAGMVVCKVYTD